MKAKFLVAALLAVALAACGGKASFTIGGTISGLNNSGLKLKTAAGDTVEVPAGATTFSFPNSISYGTEYKVEIVQQPAHMTCDFLGGTNVGSAGHTTSINIQISCVQNAYAVTGTVERLTTGDLTLVNGSSSIVVAKGATTFALPNLLPVGTAYGISVLTQPPGLKCEVLNGSGVMGDEPRNNVQVVCNPA
ncbi:hypothetical protein [Pseudoduganella sp. R-34]|uniref:hypothetical protein n=1 Tax=unclassified Pseudoduganella TaxID=2637179 RepID=UPI003CF151D8